MEKLGRFVAERRQRLDLRGDELAYRIGRAPSWLSRLENGGMKSLPEPDILRTLATELGVTMSDLLQVAGYLTSAERQQVNENPFPPSDIRYRVVEEMKAIDLTGNDAPFWVGHFRLQIRMMRDIAAYGIDDPDLIDTDDFEIVTERQANAR